MKFFVLFLIMLSSTIALGQSEEPLSWVTTLSHYVDLVAQGMFVLTILATIVTRLTPSKEDDEKAKSLSTKIHKYINYLPTLGINPKTKKLEEAFKELNKSSNLNEKK